MFSEKNNTTDYFHLYFTYCAIIEVFTVWSYLSRLCTSTLESRSWCSWDAQCFQALRQAMGAAARECKCSVSSTVLLSWWHHLLLTFSFSVAPSISAVFTVAAPLPPAARTLLGAQMVQRRCPFSWCRNTHRCLLQDTVYLCVKPRLVHFD